MTEVQAIEADIEVTRDRMGATVEELASRLSPAHLKDRAVHAVKDATIGRVRRTGRRVGNVTKRNPIPAALIGGAVALLLFEAWRRRD